MGDDEDLATTFEQLRDRADELVVERTQLAMLQPAAPRPYFGDVWLEHIRVQLGFFNHEAFASEGEYHDFRRLYEVLQQAFVRRGELVEQVLVGWQHAGGVVFDQHRIRGKLCL